MRVGEGMNDTGGVWFQDWRFPEWVTVAPSSRPLSKTSISALKLSTMTKNALRNGNWNGEDRISSIQDLIGYTADELSERRQFGKVALREVRQSLAEIGLRLKGDE